MKYLILSTTLLFFFFTGVMYFFHYDQGRNVPIPEIPQDENDLGTSQEDVREKALERQTHGIYITMYTAANPLRMQHFINLAQQTQLNTFVIDIKDYAGTVAFESQTAKEWNTQGDVVTKNIKLLLETAKEEGIYTIARLTVFQDPVLGKVRPDLTVKDTRTHAAWKDYKGLIWLDPGSRDVWEYHVALAKEAIALGFDEINLDYIRFPSDGPVQFMRFDHVDDQKKRREVLKEFIAYFSEQIADEPAYLSVDLFGLTTVNYDDLSIGQVLEDFAPYVDYICPMVYPSHYPSGFRGYANPALYPYEIIEEAMRVANQRLAGMQENRAKMRPWLQAFDIGAVYDISRLKRQIQAVHEHEHAGWLLWNARNVYREDIFRQKELFTKEEP